jgi:hypothetical protein
MKIVTYKILTHIPILGGAVRTITNPYSLTGSLERESGMADEISKLVKEYKKSHPDVQVTRQLINKLLAERK